jgi:predicted RNase H-like HicB family nuclease
MPLTVELEQEVDGRWIAEIPALAGVMAQGSTSDEAVARAQALAARVIVDRLRHGEEAPDSD